MKKILTILSVVLTACATGNPGEGDTGRIQIDLAEPPDGSPAFPGYEITLEYGGDSRLDSATDCRFRCIHVLEPGISARSGNPYGSLRRIADPKPNDSH